MEKYTLPFTMITEDHQQINELDLSIPEAIALNNLEASQTEIADLNRLMKQMTIGKKLLIERCERYEHLKRIHSPKDILENERELIEKGLLDFLAARDKFNLQYA